MRNIMPTVAVLTVLLGACPAVAAPTVTWHWHASPTVDDRGQPLAPALYYEVWVHLDSYPEFMAATVIDTVWQQLDPAPGHDYVVRVRAVDRLGRKSVMSHPSDLWTSPTLSGVPAADAAGVGPAWPNPFNPSTSIAYTVPRDAAGPVTLQVLDLRGRLVRRLAADPSPGTHDARWNGRDESGRAVAAGVYLVSLRCGAVRAVTKVTLVE